MRGWPRDRGLRSFVQLQRFRQHPRCHRWSCSVAACRRDGIRSVRKEDRELPAGRSLQRVGPATRTGIRACERCIPGSSGGRRSSGCRQRSNSGLEHAIGAAIGGPLPLHELGSDSKVGGTDTLCVLRALRSQTASSYTTLAEFGTKYYGMTGGGRPWSKDSRASRKPVNPSSSSSNHSARALSGPSAESGIPMAERKAPSRE